MDQSWTLIKKNIATILRLLIPPPHPQFSGIVKFVIIDGESRIRDENDNSDLDGNGSGIYVPNEMHHATAPSAEDDQSSVALRRRHADDISVALLHVSYRAGYELMDILTAETDEVKNAGGTRVALDNVSPASSRLVTLFWICLCVIILCATSCCLANAISNLFDAHQLQDDQQQQRRPQRRRLTLEQVRQIQVGVFDGTKLLFQTHSNKSQDDDDFLATTPVPSPHSLDACTICLDEYVLGDKLRCLPCAHAFHSRCIAKWLIERSSTCPLCKIDLYDDEVEDDIEETTNNTQQQQTVVGLFSSWASVPSEALTTPVGTATPPENRQSWTQTWRRRGQLFGSLGRNLWTSPRQRRRQAAARVSASLAEPLLNQGDATQEVQEDVLLHSPLGDQSDQTSVEEEVPANVAEEAH
jgi:hypothetical protein